MALSNQNLVFLMDPSPENPGLLIGASKIVDFYDILLIFPYNSKTYIRKHGLHFFIFTSKNTQNIRINFVFDIITSKTQLLFDYNFRIYQISIKDCLAKNILINILHSFPWA